MAKNSKDWNEGYQAAIEAIRQAMQNKGGGSDSGDPSDLDMPETPGDDQQGDGQNSRTDSNDDSHGVVRPEDCSGQSSGISDMPETPGGFFSKEDGDKLAQMEGYDKDGGSQQSVANDWKETALQEANKINSKAGNAWSNLKATIEGLYKVSTDWKKVLKQIVGKAINAADKRSAYANKNILASQGRVARTDKDKYDTMEYIVVFVDTSCSMDNKQIKMILSEVYSMALKIKPIKIYVIYCDTQIQHIDTYTDLRKLKQDAISTTRHGHGGTRVQPLWDLFKEDPRFRNIKPDLIMIFTDGEHEYLSNNQITIERDKKHMNWLVWCILDHPQYNLAKNESMTKIIHLSSKDIK